MSKVLGFALEEERASQMSNGFNLNLDLLIWHVVTNWGEAYIGAEREFFDGDTGPCRLWVWNEFEVWFRSISGMQRRRGNMTHRLC